MEEGGGEIRDDRLPTPPQVWARRLQDPGLFQGLDQIRRRSLEGSPPPSSISCDHSAVDQPDFVPTCSAPETRSAARKRPPIGRHDRRDSLRAGQAAPPAAGSTSRRDRDAGRFLLWIRLPPPAPAPPPARHCDAIRRITAQRPYEVLSVPRIDVSNRGGTWGPSSTLPSASLSGPYLLPSVTSNPARIRARSGKNLRFLQCFFCSIPDERSIHPRGS